MSLIAPGNSIVARKLRIACQEPCSCIVKCFTLQTFAESEDEQTMMHIMPQYIL